MNWSNNLNCPILGFAAFSGTGKTTLLKKLIPDLIKNNVKPAVVKHAHHKFDIDKPGKDSYEIRQAGANQVLVASQNRWALMTETPSDDPQDPDLQYLVSRLDLSKTNLILVEGFKHESFPKIEMTREKEPELYKNDDQIIAVMSDQKWSLNKDLPQLDINNIEQITGFILNYINQT